MCLRAGLFENYLVDRENSTWSLLLFSKTCSFSTSDQPKVIKVFFKWSQYFELFDI